MKLAEEFSAPEVAAQDRARTGARGPYRVSSGGPSRARRRFRPGPILLAAWLAATAASFAGAAVNLAPILDAQTNITLDGGTSYYLANEYHLTKNATIAGNGAQIALQNGPLNVRGGCTLTIGGCVLGGPGWGILAASQTSTLIVDNCAITGNGANTGIYVSEGSALGAANSSIQSCWIGINAPAAATIGLTNVSVSGCGLALSQNGGTLTWNGGTVNQADGVAVGVNGATVDVTGVSVTQSASGSIGFNLQGAASGALHGVAVFGSAHAVQLGSGALTVDQNSQFTGGHGTGLAVNQGGALTVRDSTFRYYENAIDIQPHSPAGTADVEGCKFYDADYSALSVVDAHDVRFANCLVQDANADGVYYVRSTGTVQNCRVLNSAMTGVAFLGCPNGAAIRDCLVSGNGDQGVAVVADEAAIPNPSLNVQVVNNTIVDNTLCNLLVDAFSTAYAQGNIFSQAPDASVRFQGSHGSTMEAALVVENNWGLEIRDSNLALRLSTVIGHVERGVLAYANAHPTLRHVDFRDNERGGSIGYSVFVNDGTPANLRGCTLGQIGERGLYNDAPGTATDARDNYWGTPLGPKEQWYGSSPGASVEWNHLNGSSVLFSAWLAEPRVSSNYVSTFSLSPGGTGSWDSGVGAAMSLTARSDASATGAQVLGALRCLDATALDGFTPPASFIPGHLFVVWVAYPLREAASLGAITFSAPSVAEPYVDLWRLESGGGWVKQTATWSSGSRTAVFSVLDAGADLLNGVFALSVGAPPPTPTPRPNSADLWALFD